MAPIQATSIHPQTARSRPLAGPQLGEVASRVAIALATAVVAPALLLWATMTLFNVAAAVIVALAWLVGATCWRWVTGRPVSGLLLLTLGILTVRTAFTLVSGNTFIYFAQPVVADLAVAATFLGSLWTAKPVIARLAPDFYPMSAAVTAQPGMQTHFRRLTLMWGVVILLKGGITLWLLETLSTANFVLIKGGAIITLTLTAAVVTICWTLIVGRQEGLLRSA